MAENLVVGLVPLINNSNLRVTVECTRCLSRGRSSPRETDYRLVRIFTPNGSALYGILSQWQAIWGKLKPSSVMFVRVRIYNLVGRPVGEPIVVRQLVS